MDYFPKGRQIIREWLHLQTSPWHHFHKKDCDGWTDIDRHRQKIQVLCNVIEGRETMIVWRPLYKALLWRRASLPSSSTEAPIASDIARLWWRSWQIHWISHLSFKKGLKKKNPLFSQLFILSIKTTEKFQEEYTMNTHTPFTRIGQLLTFCYI